MALVLLKTIATADNLNQIDFIFLVKPLLTANFAGIFTLYIHILKVQKRIVFHGWSNQ